MNGLKFLIAAMAISLLAGCASAGNRVVKNLTEETVQEQITKGVTTRPEIQELYGDPAQTSFTDGGQIVWEYVYHASKVSAINFVPIAGALGGKTNTNTKKLMILFDENEVVQNFSFTDSDGAIGTGIFQ